MAEAETTEFDYLGLSDKVITEEIGGQIQRSYAYSAWGQQLSQLKHDTDGGGPEVGEDSFYGYNPHTDVETLTSESGDTRATYGYTAYGSNDTEAFTGIDKPGAQNSGQESYNLYRFNGKRWDAASGSYDMGSGTTTPQDLDGASLDIAIGALLAGRIRGDGDGAVPTIAVDGKTVGATCDGTGQGGAHMLSAMTHCVGIVLYHQHVDGKSNETTQFAPLLSTVGLARCRDQC
ncbi:hypothetical protein [Amycolatopsis palatopharyngis]|uniref:hypothetical protein n=1 Tax=Amycolatopsis palatopharyngis TaxID=187982 RepID=UPI000E24DB5C|nr:hypothetical protein [Amycolatopsis palatopharyngis]